MSGERGGGLTWEIANFPGSLTVFNGEPPTRIIVPRDHGSALFAGDALRILKAMPPASVDLIFGSPPYEKARGYNGIKTFAGEDWIRWIIPICIEAARVSRGLVAFVVEGSVKDFDYSAAPCLLVADLKRMIRCKSCGKVQRIGLCNCENYRDGRAFRIRKPLAYYRHGIFGGGGPDYLKNCWEPIIAFTDFAVKRLPGANPTACGHPPKYPPGGNPSHRDKSGKRKSGKPYHPPTLANPGNVINCGAVGGGHLGSDLSHEGEAPFPEKLPEFMIPTFCPAGGIVLDPFIGTGTTAAVAARLGRRFIGIDIQEDQIALTRRRLGG